MKLLTSLWAVFNISLQYKLDEPSHIVLVIKNFHIAVPRYLEYCRFVGNLAEYTACMEDAGILGLICCFVLHGPVPGG